MMHSNWTKKNEKFFTGQVYGASLIASAIAVICVVNLMWEFFYTSPKIELPYIACESTDTCQVEIEGETYRRGIYILPSGKGTADELFMALGIDDERITDERMSHRTILGGDRIIISRNAPYLTIKRMDARTRLALDMPIDINNAGIEELMLIPGIGSQTAEAIIELRETKGRFPTKEDIRIINGIGLKTYERVKELIFVGESE